MKHPFYKLLEINMDRFLDTLKSDNELLQNGDYYKILAKVISFVRNEQIANAVKDTAETYCGNIIPDKGHEESRKAFCEWAKHAGLQSGQSLGELNTEIVGVLTWGDCLVVLERDPYALPGTISARIKIINPLCVKTPPKYLGKGIVEGKKVMLGVALDKHDIEIGYYVQRAGTDGSKDADYEYLPRYEPETGRFVSALIRRPGSYFPGQARGFPMLLSSLFSVNAIDKLSEFTVREASTKSLLGVWIESDSKEGLASIGVDKTYFAKSTEVKEDSSKEEKPKVNISHLESGDAPVLPPGSKIHTVANGGNLDIAAGIKEQEKLIAGSIGIPYHILKRDFEGINFSAGKLEIDALFRKFSLWNFGPLMRLFSEIYKWVVIEYWLLKGRIPVAEYWECDWQGPGAPDPDPLKSAHAETIRLGNGTMPRSFIVGQRGDDYSTCLEQIASDGEREQKIIGRSLPIGWTAETPKIQQPSESKEEE
jgi:capsid protein